MVLLVVLANLALLVAVLGVLTAGTWTYLDAKERGAGKIAPLWGAGVAGFVLLGVFYLYFRQFIGDRSEPASAAERSLAVIAIGSLFAAVSGLVLLPPDPVTLGWYVLGLWPIGILLGYAIVYRLR